MLAQGDQEGMIGGAWPSPCAMAATRGSLGPQRMQVQDVLLEVRQASVPTCANPRVARDFTGCGKTRCCKEPDSSRTVPAPDFLAAASISPGERFFKTRVNTPGYEGFHMLLKIHVLYQGTTLVGP
jgi:hypothetical protein